MPLLYPARRAICLLVAALATAGAAATTAEMPKRKPGLWEVNSRMEGMPNMPGPLQQCIDENTDNLMMQGRSKLDCSVMDFKPSGNRVDMHAVCKVENSTVTMDGSFEGQFNSSYRSDITSTFNPPLYGQSRMHMKQEARWIGACKAGQKPGDVVMPNMGTVNLQEMIKRQGTQ